MYHSISNVENIASYCAPPESGFVDEYRDWDCERPFRRTALETASGSLSVRRRHPESLVGRVRVVVHLTSTRINPRCTTQCRVEEDGLMIARYLIYYGTISTSNTTPAADSVISQLAINDPSMPRYSNLRNFRKIPLGNIVSIGIMIQNFR